MALSEAQRPVSSMEPEPPDRHSLLKRTLEPLARLRRKLRRWPWIPGFIILFVLVLPAIFADAITTHDPLRGELIDRLIPPAWLEGGTWEFPLGTDKQGRDILTRVIYGARISLSVGLIAMFLGAFLGSFLGLVAGYFGGKWDLFISWLIDTVHSLDQQYRP